jgi:hypothetical protein
MTVETGAGGTVTEGCDEFLAPGGEQHRSTDASPTRILRYVPFRLSQAHSIDGTYERAP